MTPDDNPSGTTIPPELFTDGAWQGQIGTEAAVKQLMGLFKKTQTLKRTDVQDLLGLVLQQLSRQFGELEAANAQLKLDLEDLRDKLHIEADERGHTLDELRITHDSLAQLLPLYRVLTMVRNMTGEDPMLLPGQASMASMQVGLVFQFQAGGFSFAYRPASGNLTAIANNGSLVESLTITGDPDGRFYLEAVKLYMYIQAARLGARSVLEQALPSDAFSSLFRGPGDNQLPRRRPGQSKEGLIASALEEMGPAAAANYTIMRGQAHGTSYVSLRPDLGTEQDPVGFWTEFADRLGLDPRFTEWVRRVSDVQSGSQPATGTPGDDSRLNDWADTPPASVPPKQVDVDYLGFHASLADGESAFREYCDLHGLNLDYNVVRQLVAAPVRKDMTLRDYIHQQVGPFVDIKDASVNASTAPDGAGSVTDDPDGLDPDSPTGTGVATDEDRG